LRFVISVIFHFPFSIFHLSFPQFPIQFAIQLVIPLGTLFVIPFVIPLGIP
jgi:hypothetical protein